MQSLQLTPSFQPSPLVVQFLTTNCPAGHRTASQEQELRDQLGISRQHTLGIGFGLIPSLQRSHSAAATGSKVKFSSKHATLT